MRLCDWLLPEENPTGTVYGVILIGALLAAESYRHVTYADTLISTAIATALYWLAHAYARLLGHRLESGERLSPAALTQALGHDWALVRGAAVPLLALVASWVAGAGLQTGVTAALWSTIASLVALEVIAGVRSHAGAGELALNVGVGLAMGVGIVAMKILLH